MKKYTEEELKKVFEDNSNCYLNNEKAMDMKRFIEILKKLNIPVISSLKNKKME